MLIGQKGAGRAGALAKDTGGRPRGRVPDRSAHLGFYPEKKSGQDLGVDRKVLSLIKTE